MNMNSRSCDDVYLKALFPHPLLGGVGNDNMNLMSICANCAEWFRKLCHLSSVERQSQENLVTGLQIRDRLV